ncbi:hypothetical protein PoB_005347200 [Plakobranchus ocellatus]|uniref:Uncharacterized protein n=1 Tax=Plakobranchus ocellatus TaxID=259542 RepID=A0AAV4C5V6_9GAST|nr:hypothetical protein PoB_005347200 [Plakobranchus ocellatus]
MARLLHTVRQPKADSSKTSTSAQQVSELKLLPIMPRREVSSKAGIKEKTQMIPKTALAMKKAVGLTWRQQYKTGLGLLPSRGVKQGAHPLQHSKTGEESSRHSSRGKKIEDGYGMSSPPGCTLFAYLHATH